MAKSNIKNKKQIKQKINKRFIKIVEENIPRKYLSYTSRIKLFDSIYNKYDKSKKQINFLLKGALNKLIERELIIKKKHSYRFSKSYLNQMDSKAKAKKNLKKNSTKKKNKKKVKKTAKVKNAKKPKIIINKPTTKLTKEGKKKLKSDISNLKNSLTNKLKNVKNIPAITPAPLNTFSLFNNNNNPNPSGGLFSNCQPLNLFNNPITFTNNNNQKNYQKIHAANWQYYDAHKPTNNKSIDHWYNYDPEASDIVEDSWQKYIVNRGMNDVRSVKSGEWEYFVDFMNWKQRNIVHSAHTQRPIRRLDEKGIVTKNPYATTSVF